MTDSSNPLASSTLRAALLERLKTTSTTQTGLQYALMATSDGYALCDTIPSNSPASVERLAAMAASFCGISGGLAEQADKQPFKGSLIETGAGLLVCRQIVQGKHEVVLLGVFESSTNHGIALWSLNNVASDIQSILQHYN